MHAFPICVATPALRSCPHAGGCAVMHARATLALQVVQLLLLCLRRFAAGRGQPRVRFGTRSACTPTQPPRPQTFLAKLACRTPQGLRLGDALAPRPVHCRAANQSPVSGLCRVSRPRHLRHLFRMDAELSRASERRQLRLALELSKEAHGAPHDASDSGTASGTDADDASSVSSNRSPRATEQPAGAILLRWGALTRVMLTWRARAPVCAACARTRQRRPGGVPCQPLTFFASRILILCAPSWAATHAGQRS